MARGGLTAAMETESLAAQLTPIFLVDFETSAGTSRWWSGFGDLTFSGNVFTGLGDFVGISLIEESTDLKATGISVSISGIPAANISLALSSMEQGRPANVYLGAMDSSNALVADPVLIFSGLTDVPTIAEDGDTSTISCTIESLEVDRQRTRVRRYTPEDQKRVDSADLGFEYVASLQDKDFIWGRN